MKTDIKNVVQFVLSHFVAAIVCFVLGLGLLLSLCALAVLTEEERVRQIGLPLLFLKCVAFVVCVTAAYVVLSHLFLGLRRWTRYPLWLPMVLVFPLFVLATMALGFDRILPVDRIVPDVQEYRTPVLFVSGVLIAGGFCIYWLVFFLSMAAIGPLQDLLIHTGRLTHGPTAEK